MVEVLVNSYDILVKVFLGEGSKYTALGSNMKGIPELDGACD